MTAGYRLRQVVDVRYSTRSGNPALELIGQCGHIVDVHQWRGITPDSAASHKELHVGLRRKRCEQCPKEETG